MWRLIWVCIVCVYSKSKKNCYKFTSNFLYYLEPWCIMNAKIEMCKYLIFIKCEILILLKIKCFTEFTHFLGILDTCVKHDIILVLPHPL